MKIPMCEYYPFLTIYETRKRACNASKENMTFRVGQDLEISATGRQLLSEFSPKAVVVLNKISVIMIK